LLLAAALEDLTEDLEAEELEDLERLFLEELQLKLKVEAHQSLLEMVDLLPLTHLVLKETTVETLL
jgi:hypothetical protein